MTNDHVGARVRRLTPTAAWPLVLGAALPLVVFLFQRDIGFNRADEGFLWYGAQRVLAGEVPLRDFQSYDIGRYYWSALWMALADDRGLVVLRFGDAVLAGATVALATWLVASVRPRSSVALALAAATFAVWMVPEYKAADSFATILLVAGLARWLGAPGPRGAALFGVALGVAATIGINHALYGTIGGALALAWLRAKRPEALRGPALAALAAGTVAGYLPVLVSMLVVPGFAAAFVDAIRLLVEAGTTNVDVPFPRLLALLDHGPGGSLESLRESALAASMIGAVVFVVACVARAWRDDAEPVFIAASFLAIPYAHYAGTSPSLMHVAVSGLPLLVCLWTFPARRPHPRASRVGAIALLGYSLFLLAHAYSGYPALRGRPLETVRVLGDDLRVAPDTARELRLLRELAERYPDRAFFAAHDWPGGYASLARRAPNWEIYQVFPSWPSRQAREIARLAAARPAFVLLTVDRPGDSSDGLEKTHPLIRDYVYRCFVRRAADARVAGLPIEVFVERAAPCGPA